MVTLSWDPISSHHDLYWYCQILKQRMEFPFCFCMSSILKESEIFKDDYTGEKSDSSYFILKPHPTKLEDSTFYFCSSCIATALDKDLLTALPHLLHVCLSPGYQYPFLSRIRKSG